MVWNIYLYFREGQLNAFGLWFVHEATRELSGGAEDKANMSSGTYLSASNNNEASGKTDRYTVAS